MKWIVLCFLGFSAFSLLSPLSLAAEEKEEKKGAEGGEKRDIPEWVDVEVRFNAINAKIQNKKENITRLIEEKKELPPNSPRLKSLIDEMVTEHREMEALSKEYDKQITIYKYRFPERGAKEHRKYEPSEVKSLDQMEKELSIDGRLNRNMDKVRSQYSDNPNAGASSSSGKAKPLNPPKPEQKAIDESDTIIMKK
jgi:hypothetical protein